MVGLQLRERDTENEKGNRVGLKEAGVVLFEMN